MRTPGVRPAWAAQSTHPESSSLITTAPLSLISPTLLIFLSFSFPIDFVNSHAHCWASPSLSCQIHCVVDPTLQHSGGLCLFHDSLLETCNNGKPKKRKYLPVPKRLELIKYCLGAFNLNWCNCKLQSMILAHAVISFCAVLPSGFC